MPYVLGTTEMAVVRFYAFPNLFDSKTPRDAHGLISHRLIDQLDLREVSVFDDKATAQAFAAEAGLPAWRLMSI